ncbi:1792_t:CDS:2 [Acaulospora morrowiae]|uniref:1792_t:CDS:1 n=1 Tax=Acaulospora morrowiae TaxID=94023 RepID=A0A9N9G399_9GLOM|nr:1792_t:CDS:2 [Acaulospora morrowiae]
MSKFVSIFLILLFACVGCSLADVTNIGIPQSPVHTGDKITINWSLSDSSSKSSAVLKITQVPDGNYTIIDNQLELSTLQENWIISVAAGTYYFSIISDDGEVRSDNFIVNKSEPTASYNDSMYFYITNER